MTALQIVVFSTLKKWYKEELSGLKEGLFCWMVPLLYYLGVVTEGTLVEQTEMYPNNWDRNRRGEKIVLDDFVLDRHTQAGRDKSLVEFATVGAFVTNEAGFVNPLWKKFYDDGKRLEEGLEVQGELLSEHKPSEHKPSEHKPSEHKEEIRRETSYEFVVRTQLTTGNSKMDVYFAKDESGKLVVIKGPFSERKPLLSLQRNYKWKLANNIPAIPFKVKIMIPDRWSEGTPLGARNTIDRNKPAYFAIWDSVVREEDLITKTHSSKLWPETTIVDWDKVVLHVDYKKDMTQREISGYVKSLLFRYVRGVSDLADRNFLLVDGEVVSIDEELEDRNVDFCVELKKKKAAFVHKWLITHYDSLGVQEWKEQEKDTEDMKIRLRLIQSRDDCLKLFDC
jgi:hypothetical protein